MCNDKIEQLKSFGFRITWTLIQIGYTGNDFISPLLTIKDVCQYSISYIEKMDFDYELAAQLASTEKDVYEFSESLSELVKIEKVNESLELRKWRVLLVHDKVSSLPQDYMEGLLVLTELWVSLGLPDDCPQIIQGRNNLYSPKDYYTQAMYDNMVSKNVEWIEKEINLIISLES